MYQKLFKPVFDVVFAFLLLFLLLPFLILTGILISFHFKKSPFFFQKRIGKEEEPFTIWKFRSLSDKRNSINQFLPDGKRMSQFGNLLRRTGIDEIPQLINIVKGDMSFVGPRPLLPEYLPLYLEETRKRHSVKPGITGLAQINGGNSLEWEKRFEYDLAYVKQCSFRMDLKILCKTIYYLRESKPRKSIGAYKS